MKPQLIAGRFNMFLYGIPFLFYGKTKLDPGPSIGYIRTIHIGPFLFGVYWFKKGK